ncbi:MAG: 3-aminobutyryl-CoA ammonia lyase [Syntrophaceae bacterium]|nr:3-aminobutyryl-CoA ammonia lyase [Syntrophaceae bacterium]
MKKARIRVRISEKDRHYRNGMVSGATIMQLMEDAGLELSIMDSGDEGFLAGYKNVEFFHTVYSGDYIEVTGWFSRIGNTSRQVELRVHKVIEAIDGSPSASDILNPPLLVARATLIGVVTKVRDRGMQIEREEYPFVDEHSIETDE